jgi:hypothetical protein
MKQTASRGNATRQMEAVELVSDWKKVTGIIIEVKSRNLPGGAEKSESG